ncbi:hypothetical protein L3X38_001485 [Prunus dulcis]|uniref:Uncharacterized protein n=1 Tax=Prunus dulcis TaxID=3755 RepID=A0AAD4WSM8_PRUDU|nr:hypothetical protein L3X38_001485 [Prunus dulcis]
MSHIGENKRFHMLYKHETLTSINKDFFWQKLNSNQKDLSLLFEFVQKEKQHAGDHCSLYRDDTFGDITLVNDSCSATAKTPNSTLFYFGIYLDALKYGVIDSADSVQKISYYFWLGDYKI